MKTLLRGYERFPGIVVSVAAAAMPLVLLVFGVYGSFSFSFSIPIIWQVGILGQGVTSLGLTRRSFWKSVLAGVLSGVILAFLGGYFLKALV